MGPFRLLSASLVAAAFASAGCGHAVPPRDPDTLVFAVRADVTGFFPNPPVSNEGYTLDINWNIIEGLVRFNSRLELEPALAERWENPDDRTYVFSLGRASASPTDGPCGRRTWWLRSPPPKSAAW